MNGRLSRGMMIVFISNLINLVFNLITNFALPKYLSVDTYASIRTYQLYVSYIGLLHLGYVDGVYLLYGGKDIDGISLDTIGTQRGSLLLLQTAVALLLAVPGFVFHETALIALCLTIIPYNVTQYYRMVYQATGEFSPYGRIVNLTTILIFSVNMLLLFVLRVGKDTAYLLGYVAAYFAIWAIAEIQFAKRKGGVPPVRASLQDLVENIRNGCLLMLGNLSSIILTGIDRWFVKFLLDTLAFAQYSFAVSMEGMLNVVVTPISTTLYNYFCIEKDPDGIHRILETVSLFAVAIIASAFPALFIVEHFLSHYLGSVSVLFFLFAGQIYFIIIKCVYVNLYKARQMQRVYFTKLVATIGIGVALNVVCFLLWRKKEAFAMGTLLSAVIWFVLCQKDFPDQKFPPRQYVYLLLETVLFLSCGSFLSAAVGFCVYLAGSAGITLLLMRQSLVRLLRAGTQLLHRRGA